MRKDVLQRLKKWCYYHLKVDKQIQTLSQDIEDVKNDLNNRLNEKANNFAKLLGKGEKYE